MDQLLGKEMIQLFRMSKHDVIKDQIGKKRYMFKNHTLIYDDGNFKISIAENIDYYFAFKYFSS